jgi:hypothetical protein
MPWNLWVSLWPLLFSLNGAVVVSLSSHHIQLLQSHVTTLPLSRGAGNCQQIQQWDRTCSASLPSSISCLPSALPLPTLLAQITRWRISSHVPVTCIPRLSLLLLTVRFSLTSSKHISRKKYSHPGQSSCQRPNCYRPYARCCPRMRVGSGQKAQGTTEHSFHAHPFYLVPPATQTL